MTLGQVLHAQHEGFHVLKFRGDIRFTVCSPAERFLQQVMRVPEPLPFIVDLLDAESLDSTALGVLALVARYMQSRFGQKANLLARKQDVLIVLNSVCFDRVFHIMDKPSGVMPDSFEALAELPEDAREFAARALRVHQALVALGGENSVRFRDVVEALEREQGSGL